MSRAKWEQPYIDVVHTNASVLCDNVCAIMNRAPIKAAGFNFSKGGLVLVCACEPGDHRFPSALDAYLVTPLLEAWIDANRPPTPDDGDWNGGFRVTSDCDVKHGILTVNSVWVRS